MGWGKRLGRYDRAAFSPQKLNISHENERKEEGGRGERGIRRRDTETVSL